MENIVARHYDGASIIVNRINKRSTFIEGPLASLVPSFLNDPGTKVSDAFLAQFDPRDVTDIISDCDDVRSAILSLQDESEVVTETNAGQNDNGALRSLATYAVRNWQLVNVNLELTYRCNQRCAMCYLDGFTQKGMSRQRLLLLASELKEAGALFVLFTGGEVFLRPDALEIMGDYEEMGFVLEIKTNGTALRPAMIERLAQLHPFDIQVSIYEICSGYSEITRSHYRFDRIVESVKQMRESNLPVTLSILVGRHNIDSLQQIHDRLSALDVEMFYSPYITPNRAGTGSEATFRLSRREMEEKLGPFLEKLNAFPERRKYRTCGDETVICYAGRDQVAIDPQGIVYPCLDLRMSLGDLTHDSLAAILAARRSYLEHFTFNDMLQCGQCPEKEYCDCCIGLAVVENGDHRVPSPHKCDVTRFYDRERR